MVAKSGSNNFTGLFVLFCIVSITNVVLFCFQAKQKNHIAKQKNHIAKQQETIEYLKDHVTQFSASLFDGDMVGIRIYYFEDDGIFAHKHELEKIDKAIIQHNIRKILKLTEPIDYYESVFAFQSRDKYVGDANFQSRDLYVGDANFPDN